MITNKDNYKDINTNIEKDMNYNFDCDTELSVHLNYNKFSYLITPTMAFCTMHPDKELMQKSDKLSVLDVLKQMNAEKEMEEKKTDELCDCSDVSTKYVTFDEEYDYTECQKTPPKESIKEEYDDDILIHDFEKERSLLVPRKEHKKKRVKKYKSSPTDYDEMISKSSIIKRSKNKSPELTQYLEQRALSYSYMDSPNQYINSGLVYSTSFDYLKLKKYSTKLHHLIKSNKRFRFKSISKENTCNSEKIKDKIRYASENGSRKKIYACLEIAEYHVPHFNVAKFVIKQNKKIICNLNYKCPKELYYHLKQNWK